MSDSDLLDETVLEVGNGAVGRTEPAVELHVGVVVREVYVAGLGVDIAPATITEYHSATRTASRVE